MDGENYTMLTLIKMRVLVQVSCVANSSALEAGNVH